MKKLLFILMILSSLGFIVYSCVKANETVSLHNGRCTGSANCTACSNCSRCGHCSSGGSCGVCRGSSSGRSFYSSSSRSRKSTKKKNSSTYTSSKSSGINATSKSYNFSSGSTILYVNTNRLNVRKSPSTKSEILEKVERYDELIYIETSGSWYKVKVEETGTVGYVYYSLVK